MSRTGSHVVPVTNGITPNSRKACRLPSRSITPRPTMIAITTQALVRVVPRKMRSLNLPGESAPNLEPAGASFVIEKPSNASRTVGPKGTDNEPTGPARTAGPVGEEGADGGYGQTGAPLAVTLWSWARALVATSAGSGA